MVTTSSLTHAAVTTTLLLLSTSFSILTSILDIKHLLPVRPTPHLWPYLQFTRLLTYQLAYTSSTELLFSTFLLYQFRVLERLYGSRKYASLIVVCYLLNLAVVPTLVIGLKLLTFGRWGYLPSGLTGVVFSVLASWTAEVPGLYRFKILTSPSTTSPSSSSSSSSTGSRTTNAPSLTLNDKSTTYLLAAQLALSQFPYNLPSALVGWIVGSAWVGDLLPAGMGRWRVPGWMVGEAGKGGDEARQYEGLRRRLEEEGARDGMRAVSSGE